MAKNYIRFSKSKSVDWGEIKEGNVFPLGLGDLSTKDFLASLQRARRPKPSKSVPLDKLNVLSPITAPCQIICQGANYKQHLIESGLDPNSKSFNLFFTKSDASLTSAFGEIIRPKHVKFLDYEIELGLVFGKEINAQTEITSHNVSEYVAAFFMANDVSARDVQLPQLQWYKGKSYKSFLPAGPHLCVLDANELELFDSLELTLKVNGEKRQHDFAENLVYQPLETLQELSGFCNLFPGDVLLTGTPSGCALRAPSPWMQKLGSLLPEKKKWELFFKNQSKRKEYLQPGDRVTSSIRSSDGKIDLGEQILTVVQGR
ncbi:fumarylacetoacetate hydrolase family protein [Leptospira idonii]|uniref:Fumarylacetoacetate hydrolase family protein n=1 Tax=Leptospira idonii TaxID=1193500 RepID=A0A4R9M0K8_9LEPT|nr:fumarylacetoacetate hydrolase family protein [Leptospira idonii]TGN20200.1 fumarylacetoacetate hydrolase family protein [Leptospira idonii]